MLDTFTRNLIGAGIKGIWYGLAGSLGALFASAVNLPGPDDPLTRALWVFVFVPLFTALAKALERARTFNAALAGK